MVIMLSGCSTNKENSPSAFQSTQSLPKTSDQDVQNFVVSKNDYYSYDLISGNEFTQYYKKNTKSSESTFSNEIKKYTFNPDKNVDFIWKKRSDTLYYFSGQNENIAPTINSYNIATEDKKVLLQIEKDHEAMYKTSTNEYIVWLEATSNLWTNGRLHIFDVVSEKDTVILEYTTDSKTGVGGIPLGSTCVIENNKVYFDQFIGIDENNRTKKMNLMCYDIDKKSVYIYREQCQYPIMYQNSLGWIEMNPDSLTSQVKVTEKEHKIIYTVEDESILTISSSSVQNDFVVIGDMLNTPMTDEIFKSVNDTEYGEKDALTIKSYGIRFLNNGKITPILLTKEPIGQFVSNNHSIGWSCEENPKYYDFEKNTVVNLDTIPNQPYICDVTKDELLFINYSDNITTLYSINF